MKDLRVKSLKEKYKELLINSLIEDIDKWVIEGRGAADVSWIEYHSPKYNNIQFYIGHLNFGTCVFINGKYGFSFVVLPFTKLKLAIKEMKKFTKNKIFEDNLSKYENAIDNR